MVQFEERRDDVSKGVAYEGQENGSAHEGRSEHCQDGVSDSNVGNDYNHHSGDRPYAGAHLRAAGPTNGAVISISFGSRVYLKAVILYILSLWIVHIQGISVLLSSAVHLAAMSTHGIIKCDFSNVV